MISATVDAAAVGVKGHLGCPSFSQDLDLFRFLGKLALDPGVFLAELTFVVPDGVLLCRLRSLLIDLRGVQAELTGRASNTNAFGECESLGTILRAVVGLPSLRHVAGRCCYDSPPVY